MKRKVLVVTLGLMLCLPTVWAENGAASEQRFGRKTERQVKLPRTKKRNWKVRKPYK